jgi:hypothetical protein
MITTAEPACDPELSTNWRSTAGVLVGEGPVEVELW